MSDLKRPTYCKCPWCGTKTYHEQAAALHARTCRPHQRVYQRVWVQAVDLEDRGGVNGVKDTA